MPAAHRPVADKAASKSTRTRQRILDAAADVLNRRGYAGTRLGEIAEVAHLQAPAIYYHFASREEVIEAVILTGHQDTIDHVRQAIDELGPDASAVDRMLAAVRAHVETLLRRSTYSSASIRNAGQLTGDVHDRQVKLLREYSDIWRELFDAGVENGEFDPQIDASTCRMLILGALNWTPEWWNARRRSVEDVVVEAQRIVRKAVLP